ncbi:MAG: pilus assembly protein TadG-related protein [Acidimicrobiia bacterium]
MRSDRGSVTLWTLGLSVLLLLFGGLAVDFWRALALQRELAAVADSAAVAAASGIDEDHYRLTGEVIIEPGRASDLGSTYVGSQDVDPVGLSVVTSSDGQSVSVRIEDELKLGLMGVFVDQSEPLTVTAQAVAVPVLVP